MALIRDAIRIDGWARAQHATHTADVRPEWCPLCPTTTTLARPEECPDCHGTGRLCETCGHTPEPPSPAAPVSRPRYRLTPEGIIPCLPDVTPAPRSLESATVAVANSPASCATTAGVAANASTSSPDAPALSLPKRTPRAATVAPVARKRKRAGTYGQLLDRLEALGATFCPECYGYFAPDHTEHAWHGIRGPVVPVAHCTLAEPCVVDGLDGQSELVTIQEREAA